MPLCAITSQCVSLAAQLTRPHNVKDSAAAAISQKLIIRKQNSWLMFIIAYIVTDGGCYKESTWLFRLPYNPTREFEGEAEVCSSTQRYQYKTSLKRNFLSTPCKLSLD